MKLRRFDRLEAMRLYYDQEIRAVLMDLEGLGEFGEPEIQPSLGDEDIAISLVSRCQTYCVTVSVSRRVHVMVCLRGRLTTHAYGDTVSDAMYEAREQMIALAEDVSDILNHELVGKRTRNRDASPRSDLDETEVEEGLT